MERIKPVLLAVLGLAVLGVYTYFLRQSAPPATESAPASIAEPSDRFLQRARTAPEEAASRTAPPPPRNLPPIRYRDVVTPPPPPPPAPPAPPPVDPRAGELELLHQPTSLAAVRKEPPLPAARSEVSAEPPKSSNPAVRLAPRTLLAGTRIRAQIVEPVRTDQAVDPLVALVLQPVYDGVGGRTVLLPAGTRAYGAVQPAQLDSKAAEIHWHRLVTPDGLAIDLTDQPATSADANGGHLDGRRRSHSGRKALAIVVTTLTAAAVRAARPDTTVSIDAAAAAEGTASAEQLVAGWAGRQLDRPPTIHLRAGTVLDLRVRSDLRL